MYLLRLFDRPERHVLPLRPVDLAAAAVDHLGALEVANEFFFEI